MKHDPASFRDDLLEDRLSDNRLRRRATLFVIATTTTFAVLLAIVGFLGLQNANIVRERSSLRMLDREQSKDLDRRLRNARGEIWRVGRRVRGGFHSRPEEFERRVAAAREALDAAAPPLDHPLLVEQWEKARKQGERVLVLAESIAAGESFPNDPFAVEALVDEARDELRQVHIIADQVSDEREDALTSRALGMQQASLALVLACVGLSVLASLVSARFVRRLFDRLAANQEAFAKVSGLLMEKQEEAARTFSQELHDELGQNLTAAKAHISRLNQNVEASDFRRQKLESLAILDESIGSTRNLSQLLHPRVLDDLGLAAALEWLTDGFSERTGIAVEQEVEVSQRLDPGLRHQLFRIAQEALTNIARHSGATKAHLSMTEISNGSSKTIRLHVTDNGKGLSSSSGPASGVGLAGMRARASIVGGNFRAGPNGSRGFAVEVTAPAVYEDEST